jgi:hypothetical protein
MAEVPLLRPYAQYLLGLAMVFLRGTGGNTTYFLGEVSAEAWKSYFLIVFGLKVPIAVLILMGSACIAGITLSARGTQKNGFLRLINTHKTEVIAISFIVFYWGTSILGNLNIGLRHVLPTFPFLYMLTAGSLGVWVLGRAWRTAAGGVAITGLCAWYVAGTLASHPFYLSYFNQFAGGSVNGHRYVVDSNIFWGQDLKRLASWVEENDIDTIKLAYFGGDDPELRLGERYLPFNASEPGQTGWLAISATLLKGGCATAVKGFDQSTRHHEWLCAMTPVTVVGNSIFVYYVSPNGAVSNGTQ